MQGGPISWEEHQIPPRLSRLKLRPYLPIFGMRTLSISDCSSQFRPVFDAKVHYLTLIMRIIYILWKYIFEKSTLWSASGQERKHCERLVCPLSTSLTVRNLLRSAFCLRIIFDHPHRVLYRVIFATGKMKYVSSRNKNDLVNMTSGIIVRRHRDASCALNPSDAVVISPRPDLSENEWNSKITSSRGLWCWPA